MGNLEERTRNYDALHPRGSCSIQLRIHNPGSSYITQLSTTIHHAGRKRERSNGDRRGWRALSGKGRRERERERNGWITTIGELVWLMIGYNAIFIKLISLQPVYNARATYGLGYTSTLRLFFTVAVSFLIMTSLWSSTFTVSDAIRVNSTIVTSRRSRSFHYQRNGHVSSLPCRPLNSKMTSSVIESLLSIVPRFFKNDSVSWDATKIAISKLFSFFFS